MARAKQNKLYRTFVKGLQTEAGYLTFPEDASYAESNTILYRKGNRTRRPGIDFEAGWTQFQAVMNENEAINEFVWRAVDESADLNFLAVQIGRYIYFYALEESPVSDSRKPFFIDLANYTAPGYTFNDVVSSHCEFTSGKGYLFIAHKFCEPLVIEYDPVVDNIIIGSISVLIRDFVGLEDNLPNEEEPLELTKEHHYNLQNQGWIGAQSNEVKSNEGAVLGGGYVYNTQTGGYNGIRSEDYADIP